MYRVTNGNTLLALPGLVNILDARKLQIAKELEALFTALDTIEPGEPGTLEALPTSELRNRIEMLMVERGAIRETIRGLRSLGYIEQALASPKRAEEEPMAAPEPLPEKEGEPMPQD